MTARFAWRLDGHHGSCRVQVPVIEVDDRGRHRVTDQTTRCGCPCHQQP